MKTKESSLNQKEASDFVSAVQEIELEKVKEVTFDKEVSYVGEYIYYTKLEK